MCDLRAGENNSFLSFQKGDLIVLEQDSGEVVMNAGWCFGECARTNQRGDFPAEYVYVLPTIIKPPPDILVCCVVLVKICAFAVRINVCFAARVS